MAFVLQTPNCLVFTSNTTRASAHCNFIAPKSENSTKQFSSEKVSRVYRSAMEEQSAPTIEVIIERILSNWAALRQAVEHGMGSSDKAREFVQWIVGTLNMNDELDALDLQDELFEYMDSEFQTQLEDNSEKEVALLVIKFYNLFKNNDIRGIEIEYNNLPPTLPWILSNRNIRPARKNNAEEDSSSDDEDDSNDNENAMEVEDGWEVVTRKR